MPLPPASSELLDLAVDIARRAGDLTLRFFRMRGLAVTRKEDGTPVTEADRAAERFIREELARRRPDDAVVGEEEGAQAGTSGVRWYVDPVDGTKAFTHGVPLYSVLLAAFDEHGPAVGVIHLPALSETVYAARGRGCFLNGAAARVSEQASLDGAYLTTSGFEHWPEAALRAVKASGLALRTWGDAYGYALVATGRAEVMVDPAAAVWDLAPMLVILPEAGGRFTDLSGAVRADGGSGVASNGRLHEAVLPLLTPR
jgi:histidinol phosphatase-like enzyme (inositol monophosphatase family)